MIDFHRVTIADKTWVDGFVRAEDSRSADFNFGNIYMWDGAYHQLLSGVGGRLLTKLKWAQQPFFAFPIGEGDLSPAVDALTERLRADGYQVASGPRTTGDGYYESCIVGIEGNQIEITV